MIDVLIDPGVTEVFAGYLFKHKIARNVEEFPGY
jgi:hypothetical protein